MGDPEYDPHHWEMKRRHRQERTPRGVATWMRNMPQADHQEFQRGMAGIFASNGRVPGGMPVACQQAVALLSAMIEKRFG